MESNLTIREAILYEKKGTYVKCGICRRNCLITEGEFGFCKTRKNINGKLFTVIYGLISSLSVNPIEKKPFFHFFPGSKALTVGSWSCNFICPWCQNYRISKVQPLVEESKYLPVIEFIKLMKEKNCRGTSISFNEPTLLLEYSLDVFREAKKMGYYNTYVSNGYMTGEALRLLKNSGLDAINFDIKGGSGAVKKFCGADVEFVWENIKLAKKLGIWIELTTLIIPGVNDEFTTLDNIANRIAVEIDPDTPWHITRYFPAFKALEFGLSSKPTPLKTLERAWEIGKKNGLKFVYIGNVPGHKYENTFCPNCGKLLIKRDVYDIVINNLTSENSCPNCGEEIPIIFS
ncbi:MAG: AmmeMemoRadiSam system radical SAM enzyme [Candidatus Odinarchaeia archaeon]